jgi:hypothetical protein
LATSPLFITTDRSTALEANFGGVTSKIPPFIGSGDSTLKLPVKAPSGTMTLILLEVASTGTATLLDEAPAKPVAEKVTELLEGSLLNPLPSTVSMSPAPAVDGETDSIEIGSPPPSVSSLQPCAAKIAITRIRAATVILENCPAVILIWQTSVKRLILAILSTAESQ